jgi:hypothetical protein
VSEAVSQSQSYGVASRRHLLQFLTVLTAAIQYQQDVLHPVNSWNEAAYERFLWDCIHGIFVLQGRTGIARVQGARGIWTSGSSFTVTLGSTPTSGNLIIIAVSTSSSTLRTISSITQTNVTWSGGGNGLQISKVDSAGTRNLELWLGSVQSSAGTVITVTLSGIPSSAATADAYEYTGLSDASTVLDQTASNATASTLHPVTGTTATTTVADELLIGATAVAGGGYTQSTPTNGFTLLDGAGNANGGGIAFLENIVSSTGSYSSGTTASGNSNAWGVIATFKILASETISVSDAGTGVDTPSILDFEGIASSDSGTGSESASVLDFEGFDIAEAGVGIDLYYEGFDAVLFNGFTLPHVLGVTVDEPPVSASVPEPQKLTTTITQGTSGRTVTITGWTMDFSDITQLRMFEDGDSYILTLPWGDVFTVVLKHIDCPERADENGQYNYTLTFLEEAN